MRAVISLGGSIVADAVDDAGDLVAALDDLADGTDTLVVVTGAGPLKRYIDAADAFDVSEARKDMVGIAATRLHATALAAMLDANVAIPEDLEAVGELAAVHDVVVLGGLLAGQSTDAVAAEVAELIGADRLVLATTTDAVYSSDPDTDPDATRFDEMTYTDLLDLLRDKASGAGEYDLMDLTAAKLIERSGIETVVCDGRNPDTIRASLGTDHGGTVIRE